jgi:hypothetical protein
MKHWQAPLNKAPGKEGGRGEGGAKEVEQRKKKNHSMKFF